MVRLVASLRNASTSVCLLVVLALVVIGKNLDDAAGLDASMTAALDHPLQFCLQRSQACNLAGDFGALMGFSEDELVALLKQEEPYFAPGTEDDQGKLDELAPKMVTCPHCQAEWDLREHGQG